MKPFLIIALIIMTLLAISTTTYATTTLFFGKTVDGKWISNDFYSSKSYNGGINASIIYFTDITDIKKIKIDAIHESGEFQFGTGTLSFEIWDLQVGYPMVMGEKGLLYITLGTQSYDEYDKYNLIYPKHEAEAALFGFDIICTPINRVQFELTVQHSIFDGVSKLYYSYGSVSNNGVDLTNYKFKLLFIITDTLGLAINYRLMDYNIKDGHIDAVDMDATSVGLIYRF